MAQSAALANNTESMHNEKGQAEPTTTPNTEQPTFDKSLTFSPETPLDPKSLPALGGVYLLADADERPIFLGYCENLRRVVPPRLADDDPENQSKRAKLGEIARSVFWKQTRGAFEGLLWHWQFARRLFPDRYNAMLGFGPCSFLRVEPEARFPRLEVVSRIRDDQARYFGPLARRKDAESIVRLLEDAFDLCRYYDVLQKTPKGDRCAYYDMGRCPAPCDGTVPLSTYHDAIREATRFLDASDAASLEPVARRMQRAANALAFENAAAYKTAQSELSRLRHRGAYAHLGDVARAHWIAIIRAGNKRKKHGETRLKAYSVCAGRFAELQSGKTAELATLRDAWQQQANEHHNAKRPAEGRTLTEANRLLARFAFKDNQRDVLLYSSGELPKVDSLLDDLSLLLDTKRRY